MKAGGELTRERLENAPRPAPTPHPAVPAHRPPPAAHHPNEGLPMPLDPYVSCPCGSGKKFKWCCAPYYPQVEKAFELEQQNQHDAALAAIQELTKAHADRPPL